MLSFNSTRGFPIIMCTSIRARVHQSKGLHSKIQCSVSGYVMAAHVDHTPINIEGSSEVKQVNARRVRSILA